MLWFYGYRSTCAPPNVLKRLGRASSVGRHTLLALFFVFWGVYFGKLVGFGYSSSPLGSECVWRSTTVLITCKVAW